MSHREKLRQARRMMSKGEIKRHVSPFQSAAWTQRAENRAIGHSNRNIGEYYRAEMKREAQKKAVTSL